LQIIGAAVKILSVRLARLFYKSLTAAADIFLFSKRHKLFYLASGTYLFVAATQADCLLFMMGGLQIVGAARKLSGRLSKFFYKSFRAAQTFLMQWHKHFF